MKMIRKNFLLNSIILVVITTLIFVLVFKDSIKVSGNSNLAKNVTEEMGIGWNLGNTLDAYSTNLEAYEISEQKRDKYQIMSVYRTKTYSGWDASPASFVSSDGSEYISKWTINKLNSNTKLQSDSFSIQFINHQLGDTGTNTLDFKVTKAEFKKKDGTIVKLSHTTNTFSESIKKNVTGYITFNLENEKKLKTASDIIGGTLTIGIKVNKYPMPIIPTMTKNDYYETLWGNPVTTNAMISEIKNAGFGAVRIPVTYYNHMDSEGTIDIEWLKRVKEVVQYVIDNDMYCIINIHHDTGANGWLKVDSPSFDVNAEKYSYVWKQISEYMSSFDNKLLFEGYNELLNISNKWSWAGEQSYKDSNNLNQIFVNTVRSTGGNNAQRLLIVNTYAASSEKKEIDAFILPSDNIKNRLIVQVHYYGVTEKGISDVVERLNNRFVSKGIPVIIGESGMNLNSTEEVRAKYASYLVTKAKENDITIFWWDDGNYMNQIDAISNYALYDRHAMKWKYPNIVIALVD